MELDRPPMPFLPLAASLESAPNESDSCLDIELDDQAGHIRVNDARLFRADRRVYAQRLLEALCENPGVRKAEVDLVTSTCRVDFDLASNTTAFMAEVFVNAVRSASTRAGRPWWWTRSAGWTTLTAFRSFGDVSLWETYVDDEGQTRLLHRGRSSDRSLYGELAERVLALEGVEQCRVSFWSHRITIVCDATNDPWDGCTLDRVERILGELKAGGLQGADCALGLADPKTEVPALFATGWRRWKYTALAGGAFVLTIVGLILPGIPTFPFLLATGYYLARSSPSLDAWFRRTAFFGPMLQEWEDHGALSRNSKGKLVLLTAAIVVVSAVFMALAPTSVGVMVLLSLIGFYGIWRMPNLANDAQVGLLGRAGAVLALPAP